MLMLNDVQRNRDFQFESLGRSISVGLHAAKDNTGDIMFSKHVKDL